MHLSGWTKSRGLSACIPTNVGEWGTKSGRLRVGTKCRRLSVGD